LALNFAFFAVGPLLLIPFILIGAAGGAAVLWVGQERARWVRGAFGVGLVGQASGGFSSKPAPVLDR